MRDRPKPLENRLLEVYRNLSQEGNFCQVAFEELRRMLGVDRNQLVVARRALQEMGYIVVRRRYHAPDLVELTERPPLPAERLLTPQEAAAILGVSTKTLARREAEGRIEAVKTPGGHRRYREDDVKGLAEAQKQSAAGDPDLDGLKWELLALYRTLAIRTGACQVTVKELGKRLKRQCRHIISARRALQEEGYITIERRHREPDVVRVTEKPLPSPLSGRNGAKPLPLQIPNRPEQAPEGEGKGKNKGKGKGKAPVLSPEQEELLDYVRMAMRYEKNLPNRRR
jgi:excisionase family DNA binding protein